MERAFRGRGGIGRRAALRSLWGNPWKFEFSRPHHSLRDETRSAASAADFRPPAVSAFVLHRPGFADGWAMGSSLLPEKESQRCSTLPLLWSWATSAKIVFSGASMVRTVNLEGEQRLRRQTSTSFSKMSPLIYVLIVMTAFSLTTTETQAKAGPSGYQTVMTLTATYGYHCDPVDDGAHNDAAGGTRTCRKGTDVWVCNGNSNHNPNGVTCFRRKH